MGTTTKYGFRWPESISAFVRNGADAIKALAEDVDAALMPPMLLTKGADDPVYVSGEGAARWSLTSGVQASRGTWTSPQTVPELIIPPAFGVYLVQTSVRFGGKSEADTFQVRVESQVSGSTSTTLWNYEQVEVADTYGGYTQLSTGAIVPITQANEGIRVMARYGGTQAPTNPAADTVHRLQVYRLSAI